jgi:hypothetical protein
LAILAIVAAFIFPVVIHITGATTWWRWDHDWARGWVGIDCGYVGGSCRPINRRNRIDICIRRGIDVSIGHRIDGRVWRRVGGHCRIRATEWRQDAGLAGEGATDREAESGGQYEGNNR